MEGEERDDQHDGRNDNVVGISGNVDVGLGDGQWEEVEEEIGSWFPPLALPCRSWRRSVLTQSFTDTMLP